MAKNRKNTRRSRPHPQPRKSGPSQAEKPEGTEVSAIERKPAKSALTFRQQSALSIVAAAPSISQAARDSGIGESTLRRWLDQDVLFNAELNRLRQESSDLVLRELHGLMLRGISVLADSMQDPDPAIRLRATRYALSFASRIYETEKLGTDIQSLEEAVNDRKPRQTP